MVEELKLAIKIDDATIEQSLLKQFANAQKMADKVVLDFKNVNFDDKQIEAKFKEMQKKAGQNPIDFSISGNTLDMLGQIDKRLTEIFSIGKGKSFIDSSSTDADIGKIENKINELNKKINTSFDTKNKTEAYNQLKKYADAFKDYYNNEEAMASESGTKAAYAYYKAYEEALKKEVAQSKLEKVTVDFDINDKFFDKNRIVSDRIKEYANYKKYGSDNDLLEEISSLKNKLFDFNSAYSQVKEKLGQAAITPEIIKSVERYVELLDKARFLEQLNDPDDNDTIKSHRAMAQVSLDDALFNAQEQSYKYTKSLRQQEEQLTSTVEAEQKLAEVQKETTSNSVTSDNSQIEELKSDIQEVKTELGDVKDRISSIESNGFENVREDVEKTKESVKELNSELTEIKSNLSSTPQESNISSGTKDAFPKTSENLEQVAQSEQKVQQEAVATDKTLNNISFTPNTEGFEDIITKFGILREQAEQITKIVKTTKQTADGTPNISYKATLKNGSSYYLGENSTPQVLNASETVYDAKADNTKKLEREKQIWNELTTSLDRYATLQKRITSNNALSTDNEEATKLLEHIHELQRNDVLPTEKLTASNEKLQQINQTVTDLKAKLKESTLDSLQGSIDKYQKIYDQRKTYSSDFTPSEQYTKNLTELDTAIGNLVEYRNTLKNVSEVTVKQEAELKGLVTACEKASDSFKSLSASEKGASQIAIDKLVQRINKDLDECTNYSKEAKLGLRALRDELESANPRNLKEITSEIINIENAEIRAGRAGRSFFDTLKNSGFHQIAAQMAGMFGLYDVINIGRQAISTIVDLDDALLDLKKTTSMSSTELKNFYYSANDVAKQMGVTTKSIIEQASAWSRLGYSSNEQATEMAKLSSKFASISPGMDTDQAQEGMVSIMKAWQINPEDVEKEILDPINQLGNKFAESNDDIVEGMKRSAAALAAVGTDYKDAYSLFTGVQEVLQNSEVAGRALRSISMRIRGYDENSEDGFEQTDDELKNITGDLIDLTKTAQHAQGVSIFKEGSTTEFKSLVDYFGEIHDIWDEMSQKQQNDFLQKAFGKTQAQAGAALIQNYDAVKEALAEIDKSAGSADKEMSTVEQTLSYKINALKETWVGCAQQILDRGDLGIAISGLNGVSKVITGLIDNVGLLKTAAMGVAATLSFKNVGGNKMHFPMNILDNIHNLLWIQRFRVCYP